MSLGCALLPLMASLTSCVQLCFFLIPVAKVASIQCKDVQSKSHQSLIYCVDVCCVPCAETLGLGNRGNSRCWHAIGTSTPIQFGRADFCRPSAALQSEAFLAVLVVVSSNPVMAFPAEVLHSLRKNLRLKQLLFDEMSNFELEPLGSDVRVRTVAMNSTC